MVGWGGLQTPEEVILQAGGVVLIPQEVKSAAGGVKTPHVGG